ncbi:MAG TPA: hypothetical protein HPP94_08710 [Desulfuromonadales bacterium]|nr:hypothetical protein [Desulfuromonadales bacterium]
MSDHAKYLNYLQVDELPEHYQVVISVIGIDATVKLAEAFPGVPLYFKQVHHLLYPAKRAYILAYFSGANQRRLALDTGLTLKTVYKIIKDDHNEKHAWKQEELI